jgi:hypothetical protein
MRAISLIIIALFTSCGNLSVQKTLNPQTESNDNAGKAQAHIEANEGSAIAALKMIVAAQATYQATGGNGSFGDIKQLTGLIPVELSKGDICGYKVTITKVVPFHEATPSSYEAIAVPLKYGETGRKSFFVDESGAIRSADRKGDVAGKSDPYIDAIAIEPFNGKCLPVIDKNSPESKAAVIVANEQAAIRTLRTIVGAEYTYQATMGNGSFGSLKHLVEGGLMSPNMAEGVGGGYRFEIGKIENKSSESPPSFEVIAMPVKYGITGQRSFYADESGVIRGADKNGAAANVSDKPIK